MTFVEHIQKADILEVDRVMGGGKQRELLEYNQCQEAVLRLNEYLSQELRPDEEEEIQQHLSQCKECFSRFQFEEMLLRTIRVRAEQVHAPLALRDKILGLLVRPESAAPRSDADIVY